MATRKEIFISELKKNGEDGKVGITVEDIRRQTSDDISPQVQYFSSDFAIKDTSDGPKVAVHCYGNNDEQTMKRAIVIYLEGIKNLDEAKKQGYKIGMDKKDI